MPPAELDPFQAFLKGSEQFFKQSGDEIGKAFDSVAQALSLPLPKKAEEQPTEARPESLASAPAAAPAVEAPVLAPAPAVAVKAEPSTGAGVISEDAAVISVSSRCHLGGRGRPRGAEHSRARNPRRRRG